MSSSHQINTQQLSEFKKLTNLLEGKLKTIAAVGENEKEAKETIESLQNKLKKLQEQEPALSLEQSSRLKYNTEFLFTAEKTTSEVSLAKEIAKFDRYINTSFEKVVIDFVNKLFTKEKGEEKEEINNDNLSPIGGVIKNLKDKILSKVKGKKQIACTMLIELLEKTQNNKLSSIERCLAEQKIRDYINQKYIESLLNKSNQESLNKCYDLIDELINQIPQVKNNIAKGMLNEFYVIKKSGEKERRYQDHQIVLDHIKQNLKDLVSLNPNILSKEFLQNVIILFPEYYNRITDPNIFTDQEKIQLLEFDILENINEIKEDAYINGINNILFDSTYKEDSSLTITEDNLQNPVTKISDNNLSDLLQLARPEEIRKTFYSILWKLPSTAIDKLCEKYFPNIKQEKEKKENNVDVIDVQIREDTIDEIEEEFIFLSPANPEHYADFLARKCLQSIIDNLQQNDAGIRTNIKDILVKVIRERIAKEKDKARDLLLVLIRKTIKYLENPSSLYASDALTIPLLQKEVAKGEIRLTDLIDRAWQSTTLLEKFRAIIKYMRCVLTFKFTMKEFSAEKAWKELTGELTFWQKVQRYFLGTLLSAGKIATSAGAVFVLAPDINTEVYLNTVGNAITCTATRGPAFFEHFGFGLTKPDPAKHIKERSPKKDLYYFMVGFVAIVSSICYGGAYLVSAQKFLAVLLGIPFTLFNPWVLALAVVAMLSFSTFYLAKFEQGIREFFTDMLINHPLATIGIGLLLLPAQGILYYFFMAKLAILFPIPVLILAAGLLTIGGFFTISKQIISLFLGKEKKYKGGKYLPRDDMRLNYTDKAFSQKCRVIFEFFAPFKLIYQPLADLYKTCRNYWRHDVVYKDNKLTAVLYAVLYVFTAPITVPALLPIFCLKNWGFAEALKWSNEQIQEKIEEKKQSNLKIASKDINFLQALIDYISQPLSIILSICVFPYFLAKKILDYIFPEFSRQFVINACKAIKENFSEHIETLNGLINLKPTKENERAKKIFFEILSFPLWMLWYPLRFIFGGILTLLTSPIVLGWIAWRDIKAYAIQGSIETGPKILNLFNHFGDWLDKVSGIAISGAIGLTMALTYNVGNSVCFTWLKSVVEKILVVLQERLQHFLQSTKRILAKELTRSQEGVTDPLTGISNQVVRAPSTIGMGKSTIQKMYNKSTIPLYANNSNPHEEHSPTSLSANFMSVVEQKDNERAPLLPNNNV